MTGWRVAALVADPVGGEILVDGSDGSDGTGARVPRLPSVELPPGESPDDEVAFGALEELLGAPIVSLRKGEFDVAEDRESGTIVILIGPIELGRGGASGLRRVAATDVLENLEPAGARDAIRSWLERLHGPPVANEPPWARAGWFERATAWMTSELTKVDLPPTEPVRIMYQSVLGTIILARYGDRATYLKCPVPYFHAEPTITVALARRTPGWVPDVIAIEPAEGWLLMHDLGGGPLGKEPPATWPSGATRIAQIQSAWVGHVDELVAAGAHVRPLEPLIDGLPTMLDRAMLGDRLAPEVRAAWTDATPRLIDACRRLADIGLPDSVIHGDLHPWNIAVTERGLVVFDWSDAAVGNPFVDLAVTLGRVKDIAVRRQVLDAYLDGWADLLPRDRLETAATAAMAAGGVYQVETYLRLLPGLDPLDRGVFAAADVRWASRALAGLEHGLETP
jgi:hypothetical protein